MLLSYGGSEFTTKGMQSAKNILSDAVLIVFVVRVQHGNGGASHPLTVMPKVFLAMQRAKGGAL
ncbi:MAG: hypothetical protein BWK76_00545 [Desulfobulbaceae bacterium A2]|nr:MAG: hypothetical protein BWK76_00545 [Desulfobulbaceae bacterium A2]